MPMQSQTVSLSVYEKTSNVLASKENHTEETVQDQVEVSDGRRSSPRYLRRRKGYEKCALSKDEKTFLCSESDAGSDEEQDSDEKITSNYVFSNYDDHGI